MSTEIMNIIDLNSLKVEFCKDMFHKCLFRSEKKNFNDQFTSFYHLTLQYWYLDLIVLTFLCFLAYDA